MKFFFGILSLVFITIEARGTPKIEIFEIRETDKGLELKNLNSNTRNHQSSDTLLKLLRAPKAENAASKLAKQLLSKLKYMQSEEQYGRYSDDAHIYILNSDVLDDETDYEELYFVDKTRHERSSDRKDLRDVLLQLLQPQKKRKLRQTYKRPQVVRTGDVIADGPATLAPIRKRQYEYE